MSIANRIEKLETACGVDRCPACGAPDVRSVIVDETEDAQPVANADAAPCYLCGSMPRIIRIIDEVRP